MRLARRLMTTLKLMASPNVRIIIFHRITTIHAIWSPSSRRDRIHHSVGVCVSPRSTIHRDTNFLSFLRSVTSRYFQFLFFHFFFLARLHLGACATERRAPHKARSQELCVCVSVSRNETESLVPRSSETGRGVHITHQ